MKRSDRILYAVTVLSAIAALGLVLAVLPSGISFSFSDNAAKSSWYLVLLALLPLFSTLLVSITDKSRLISAAVIAVADGYAVLVVLQALGTAVNFSVIILLLLTLLSAILTAALNNGKIKAKPAWADTEDKVKKASVITAVMFALMAVEFLIMTLLVLFFSINGGFIIVPVLITAAIFMLILARKTI